MRHLSPIDFLRHFHRSGEKFFCGAISPFAGGRDPRWWWLDLSEVGGKLSEFRAENNQGMGIYFSVASFIAPQRKKENLQVIRSLWLDFNAKTAASKAFAEGNAWKDIPAPNILVNTSPKGIQAYWLLEESPYSFQEVERVLRALVRVTKANSTAINVTRILRLPGFANSKYRPSYPHVEAHVIHELRNSLGQFQEFERNLILHPPDKEHDSLQRSSNEIGLVARQRARERWVRVTRGKSPSEADWAVCGYLNALGVSPESIEGFLREIHPGKHKKYYAHTVLKFFSKYGEETQK